MGLLSLINIALYCSHAEIRVLGGVVGGVGWCKPIIVSNPTFVELCLGCFGVVLWLSCSFDNKNKTILIVD